MGNEEGSPYLGSILHNGKYKVEAAIHVILQCLAKWNLNTVRNIQS